MITCAMWDLDIELVDIECVLGDVSGVQILPTFLTDGI